MLIISSGGVNISISCSQSLYIMLIGSEFMRSYIPGVESLIEKIANSKFTLEITESPSVSFTFFGNTALLKGKVGENLSIEDIVTVIDYCLEYLRQKIGIYCVHGSAVNYKGLGILILGGVSGLGKTTLALNLCTEKKAAFIGDEKILLQNDRLIGGVKRIVYNKQWLYKSTPKEKIKNMHIEDKETKLELVIQPNIFSKGKGIEIDLLDKLKANFHIYEEMSRKIRGVSRRISNFTYPLMSLDSYEISKKRSEYAKSLSENVPFYSIKGNINEVMNQIVDILSKN
ncbi:hypothetical protein A3D00_04740 [Candidatus Woesebacteria bacterium RIFCSPHIGHO2_02_FULL_38_9]|uniref:HPr kinase/phosphorylase C-terminal domain-containing protein n=1 Tax=Candidatus Woesebacteria bacterium RIFCSPHIGHO2_01_FULL_39_28 TaxID=1802496 RepID=A0A1F7YHS1_9BACT|nr:MAG: hypothetical protein A2627_04100 [Candidatus Woesebacteria bacterium RIFCSPHIGHO2_01_FULL_39_28]OGM34913.1 MAG: hypothetical protein A3D00_04740 [Candidatus Woesebacteria bacterium RIFCSPHIGHO2_02_FULL_38_9]OGM58678.1 MAG: hypothetical protein A3A50_02755 [Candidatus Woesebacteria bacterium RIFCSPLOWO2_01_FULL_38_20]